MAEKLGLNGDVRPLKIGQSFTNPKSTPFHSIKYDFKPASVDKNKIATVDVGNNHQVTVTVPHLDGAGVPQTVFKGSQRPYHKECVLIIDRVTGEITLERLGCNIQVKKTRSESTNKLQNNSVSNNNNNNNSSTSSPSTSLAGRSQTPPIGQRISHRTKVTSGSRRPDRQITHLVPKHSPLHASPSYPSPGHIKSPSRRDLHNSNNINNSSSSNNNNTNNEVNSNQSNNNSSTLASLPMIALDDFSDNLPTIRPQQNITTTTATTTITTTSSNSIVNNNNNNSSSTNNYHNNLLDDNDENHVGEISDTSSSSSDSESDSDLDNTVVEKISISKTNGHISNNTNGLQNNTTHLLNEDLCLSESGSDSD